jgi:hypothetical protein
MKPLEFCLFEISLLVLDVHNSNNATSEVFETEVKQQINVVNYYSIYKTIAPAYDELEEHTCPLVLTIQIIAS